MGILGRNHLTWFICDTSVICSIFII